MNDYQQSQSQSRHLYDRIFMIEVEKIKPNPMQPRKEFDDEGIKNLAESIKQYGVLQPLIVIRQEYEIPTGTAVEYELIAGERRLRAAKLAGLRQIPVIIKEEPAEKVKLEMALVENIQREDINAIERARAFKQLVEDFNLRHYEIGDRIGKSREFVTNTLRLLFLPEEMQNALIIGTINEGHTRPLLMLNSRPEDQLKLFQEIVAKNLTVRDAEQISRKIAFERARKYEPDQEIRILSERLENILGTRVYIERRKGRGKIAIEFFSDVELKTILTRFVPEMPQNNIINSELPADINNSEDSEDYKANQEEIQNFTI